jgi:hypothetical protein
MKRNILVAAICALVTFGFMSCEKNPTKTELLQTKKGWKLTKASCYPPYESKTGVLYNDLVTEGFLFEEESDDITIFKTDGGQYLDYGTKKFKDQTGNGETLGRYSFNEEKMELKYFLPYWDELVEVNGNVSAITENSMTVGFKISEDDGIQSKATRNYNMTFTYTAVK